MRAKRIKRFAIAVTVRIVVVVLVLAEGAARKFGRKGRATKQDMTAAPLMSWPLDGI